MERVADNVDADMGMGMDVLTLMGEELKQPLVTILQLSEMGDRDRLIASQAQKALNTVDSVLLYRRLLSGQQQLNLQPTHVGHAMTHVERRVRDQAAMNGCQNTVSVEGSLQPVDVDSQVLQSALVSVWQAVIQNISDPQEVVCSAHMTKNGVRLSVLSAGVDTGSIGLTKTAFRSRQPIRGVPGAAADLLAAKELFALFGATLTRASARGMRGFGVTLPKSMQLQLL